MRDGGFEGCGRGKMEEVRGKEERDGGGEGCGGCEVRCMDVRMYATSHIRTKKRLPVSRS